jgi:hypothetical protein
MRQGSSGGSLWRHQNTAARGPQERRDTAVERENVAGGSLLPEKARTVLERRLVDGGDEESCRDALTIGITDGQQLVSVGRVAMQRMEWVVGVGVCHHGVAHAPDSGAPRRQWRSR